MAWQMCPTCEGSGTLGRNEECSQCKGIGKVTAFQETQRTTGAAERTPIPTAFLSQPLITTQGTVVRQCADCSESFELPASVVGLPDTWQAGFQRCPPCQEQRAEAAMSEEAATLYQEAQDRLERHWRTCGVGNRQRNVRLSTFAIAHVTPIIQEAWADAKQWAERVDVLRLAGTKGLMFSSEERGTGKTHLMAGILRSVLERRMPSEGELLAELRAVRMAESDAERQRLEAQRRPVGNPIRFVTAPDLLNRITQSRRPVRFDADAPPQETEEEIYEALGRVPLLAIDDLGQVSNVWDRERQTPVWEQVIGIRYNADLPLLATTNLGLAELRTVVGDRAASRLLEMVDMVPCDGEDYRMRALKGA